MSARPAARSCAALKRVLPITLASLVCVAGCAQPPPKVMGANADTPTASASDVDGTFAFAAPLVRSGSESADGCPVIDANWLVDTQPNCVTGQQVLMLDAMQSH